MAFICSRRTARSPSQSREQGSRKEMVSSSNQGIAKEGINGMCDAERRAGMNSLPGKTRAKGTFTSSFSRVYDAYEIALEWALIMCKDRCTLNNNYSELAESEIRIKELLKRWNAGRIHGLTDPSNIL